MNIFRHELKAYRKSAIIWTVSLLAVVLLFMSLFPSISKDIDEFKKVLEGFPEAVRNAIGLQLDTIGSILGFYSYMFVYISLCGAIQAMNLGTSILSKETREKTADFLLTKPVTRTRILTAKILAALALLAITNIIFITAAAFMASQVNTEDYSGKLFFMISITLFFIQVIFLSLGILASVVFRKIKSVLSVSLGTVFSFFVIGMIAGISGDKAMRYFSPFKYYDPNYVIENAGYEAPFLITGLVVPVLAIAASYLLYLKKDIHAV